MSGYYGTAKPLTREDLARALKAVRDISPAPLGSPDNPYIVSPRAYQEGVESGAIVDGRIVDWGKVLR